ncbi:hypothetical protein ACJX0J_008238 [Zea mays]
MILSASLISTLITGICKNVSFNYNPRRRKNSQITKKKNRAGEALLVVDFVLHASCLNWTDANEEKKAVKWHKKQNAPPKNRPNDLDSRIPNLLDLEFTNSKFTIFGVSQNDLDSRIPNLLD